MSIGSIQYDFEKIAYGVDPFLQQSITQSTKEKPIDATIQSLFISKNAPKPSAFRLEEAIDLTERLIIHLDQTASLWQKLFGSPSTELKKLQGEFTQKLQSMDAEHQVAADRALTTSPPDIAQLATLYYQARLPLRKTDSFINVQRVVKQNLATFLQDPGTSNLNTHFPFFFTTDPLLEWTNGFAAQNPNDLALLRVTSALQRSAPSDTPPQNISEALAQLLWSIYTKAGTAHTSRENFEMACNLLAPIQQCLMSPQTDANWQQAIDCIAKTALGGDRYNLLFFVLLKTAEFSIQHKALLPALKSGIAYLISKQEDFDLIHELIFSKPSERSAEQIVSALNDHTFASNDTGIAKKIMMRYWQIATVPDATARLSKPELLRLAYFDAVLLLNPTWSSGHYNKRMDSVQHRCSGIQTSVEQDADTKATTILLKRKGTFFEGKEGSIKRPRVALLIPQLTTDKAERVCRTVNHSFLDKEKTIPAGEELARELRQEAALQKSLSHIRGIWKLISWCDYTTIKNGVECKKVSMITELASHDMDYYSPPLMNPLHKFENPELIARQYHERITNTPRILLIQMLSDIAHGLKVLHGMKRAHGDVKASNAFVLMDGTRFIKAGLSDLGHSDPAVRRKHALNLYGTVVFSAPELFTTGSTVNHAALDVWAFGCMLYAIFEKKDPSWICNLLNLKGTGGAFTLSYSEKITLQKFVKEEIEDPLTLLCGRKTLKPDERIKLLTYHCLRYKPDDRWTMGKIYEELEALKTIL